MIMKNKKRFILVASSMLIVVSAFAQNEEAKKDAQEAIAAAAQVINATPRAEVEPPKPKYWTQSLMTRVNFDQTSLTNWKAGGLNNSTLNGYIDANAKYAKDKTFWNNRLQLDYGFIYQQGRPFIQKNTDRIYLESKWGRRATEKMNYTANFDFRSQFSDSWNYVIPKSDGEHEPTKKDWMNARSLKSGFLSPANVHLGLGMDWTPNPKTKWLAVNFSPLTGGFTIVANEILRYTNGMKRKQAFSDAELYPYEVKDGSGTVIETHGDYFRAAKFELGASLKVDLNLKINQNLTYASQLLLFSDYLDNPQNLRVNWDNRINWVLAKHFTLSLSTFLIYDDNVRIVTEDHPAGTRSVQFKELLGFGFTYTFPSAK
jgi:hypothetical protein